MFELGFDIMTWITHAFVMLLLTESMLDDKDVHGQIKNKHYKHI